jgi:flavin reductase (DIM6/NTAB) family NADH-FMN oxidoreductase RutF
MALAAPANPAPARDARTFRDALGRLATGVAFVTAAPDGEPAGLIVNSLTSVSLEPPLIAFSPARRSHTWAHAGTTDDTGGAQTDARVEPWSAAAGAAEHTGLQLACEECGRSPTTSPRAPAEPSCSRKNES